ncbi:MAG: trypsin-like peptidase domain-containing protein [Candidatus Riflebacteria bacterium]|nr:trypsin-like peptidase domain-containing protein [Candidatus Riflebacteria bacterium]
MATEQNETNGNLIVALVAVLVFIIIGLVFWYRQNQRDLVMNNFAGNPGQSRATFVDDRMNPPNSVPNMNVFIPKVNPPSGIKTYKQILEAISPSIVSISATPEIEEEVPVNNPQAQLNRANQTANKSFLVCPNDGTRIPNPNGVASNIYPCPICSTKMLRDDPANQQANQQAMVGSGVIVHSRGYILTNLHIVKGAANINVTISYGSVNQNFTAELTDEAPEMDLAILKIINNRGDVFQPAPIADSSLIMQGDKVMALGGLFGFQQSVNSGVIANTNRTLTLGTFVLSDLIQVDATLSPESTGGPLLNANGEVIGINTAIYFPNTDFSGKTFAIPINYAVTIFPDFIEMAVMNNRFQNAAVPAGVQANMQPAVNPVGVALPNPQPAVNAVGVALPNAQPVANAVPVAFPNVQTVAAAPRGSGANPWCPPNVQPIAAPRGSGANPWCPPAAQPVAVPACPPGNQFSMAPRGQGLNAWCPANAQPVALPVNVAQPLPTQGQTVSPSQFNAVNAGALSQFPVNTNTQFPTANANVPAAADAAGAAAANAAEPPEPPEPPEAPAAGGIDPATIPLTGMMVGGEVEAGSVGVLDMVIEEITPDIAATYGLPASQQGLVVAEVEGIAQTAGLTAGDVLIGINNQPVKNAVDFINIMNMANPQVGVDLDISRSGQLISIRIKG